MPVPMSKNRILPDSDRTLTQQVLPPKRTVSGPGRESTALHREMLLPTLPRLNWSRSGLTHRSAAGMAHLHAVFAQVDFHSLVKPRAVPVVVTIARKLMPMLTKQLVDLRIRAIGRVVIQHQ